MVYILVLLIMVAILDQSDLLDSAECSGLAMIVGLLVTTSESVPGAGCLCLQRRVFSRSDQCRLQLEVVLRVIGVVPKLI